MRYATLGDWYFDVVGDLVIEVAVDDLSEDHQNLIALHELIEALLCRKRDITQSSVDIFDIDYGEKEGEPGDQPTAPYRKEHRFAMLIEHLMAHELGVEGYGTVT